MADTSPEKGNACMAEQRTHMTDEQAERWAWEQVRRDVGTEGWTAGDSCNYYGFFLWGWRYRAQYQRQRATPPSPSTAPEVKTWQERCGDTGMMPSLREASLAMKAEIAELRAALASRPAEVDDEGLPPLPDRYVELSTFPGRKYFTAEQYRQGQRDAVAADRARRGLIGFVTDIQTTEYALRPSGRAVITCALTVRSTELWVPGRLWLIDPSKLRMPARGAA